MISYVIAKQSLLLTMFMTVCTFYRERDSMKQVRMPLDDVAPLVRALSNDKMSWTDVTEKYPIFEQQEATK